MCTPYSSIPPAGVIDVQQNICSTVHVDSRTSAGTPEMTCKKIQNLLLHKDKTIRIIENPKKHSASCWN